MTNGTLAHSYLLKAKARLKILSILQKAKDYSDVVREAQEIVELSLKGMLRFVGVEPPKWHDVGSLLVEHASKFTGLDEITLKRLVSISATLRKEREIAFYGDVDFIPTEEYLAIDGKQAMKDAAFAVLIAKKIIR